jgi:predicted O-methyltransferase YrrM
MKHFYENIYGHFDFQDLYTRAIRILPSDGVFVEVGTLSGKSAAFALVEATKRYRWDNIKFHFIDNCVAIPDQYNAILQNLEPIHLAPHLIFNLIPLESVKASELFLNNSIDFCFLDAGHGYDDVTSDIKAWLPKVKAGGILAGHDYSPDYQENGIYIYRDNVIKAVDDYFGKDNIEILNHSWVYRKKD